MSYVDKHLLENEKVLFRTHKHIIIFLIPLLWSVCSIYISYYMYMNPILTNLVFVPWFLACVFWIYATIAYFLSEFAVTDKRVIMREGLFNKHIAELRISTISQVNVNQSVFGQLFNYGTVTLNAFGASDSFYLIDQPYNFQKHVNAELDRKLA